MAFRFDKLALKEPKTSGTNLQEAIEIMLPHLQKIGVHTTPEQDEYQAQITLKSQGPNTILIAELRLSECYIKKTAMVTVRAVIEENGNPLKSDFLPFDTLTGDPVTADNAGPSLIALLAIKEAIKEGAELLEAYQVGKSAYLSAKRAEKFGTTNRIRLNLPFSEKDQAKAQHPGRLLWNKTERSWYYHGNHLPEDLEPFRDTASGDQPLKP